MREIWSGVGPRSPQLAYRETCERLGLRVNRGVEELLSSQESGFDDTTELDFRRACIGGNGLGPLAPVLAELRALRVLDISDNYLSNESVVSLCDALQGHPRLRTLRLAANPISYPAGKRLEALAAQCPALSDIDVSVTLMNPGLAKRVAAAAAAKRPPAMSAAALREDGYDHTARGHMYDAADADRTNTGGNSASSSPAAAPSQPFTPGGAAAAAGRSPFPGAVQIGPPAITTGKPTPPTRAVRPEDRWYALETVWAVAADAPQAADGSGFPGLLSVLAHTRFHAAA